MTTLRRNVPPEDTQNQWMGEAALKGWSSVRQTFSFSATFDADYILEYAICIVDNLYIWIIVYIYVFQIDWNG